MLRFADLMEVGVTLSSILRSTRLRLIAAVVVMCGIVAAQSGIAHAHRVNIFAWIEGASVVTSSEFGANRPAKGATVQVYGLPSGDLLLSGLTDDTGRFAFPLPQTSSKALRIALNLGDGHAAEWRLDIPAADAEAKPAQSAPGPAAALTAQNPHTEDHSATTQQQDMARMVEHAVDAALERRLAPIAEALARQQSSGPRLAEILGGLGWLIGIAGIAAWASSRSKSSQS